MSYSANESLPDWVKAMFVVDRHNATPKYTMDGREPGSDTTWLVYDPTKKDLVRKQEPVVLPYIKQSPIQILKFCLRKALNRELSKEELARNIWDPIQLGPKELQLLEERRYYCRPPEYAALLSVTDKGYGIGLIESGFGYVSN